MKKKKFLSILIASCAICAAAGGFAIRGATAENVYFADIFDAKGVSIFTDCKIDGDERQGLALVTQRQGTSLALAKKMAGELSMDFKFYTESKDYYLTEAVLSFQDRKRADNKFDLHIANSELGVMYYVTINGQNAGVYYEAGNATFLTAEFNKKSMYTRVETDADMTLSFDPETLCLYVQTDPLNKYLIWNLSVAINDGRDVGASLLPFGDYDVSVNFKDFYVKVDAPVAYSGLQVFELNGQSMNGIAVADNAAPTLHANVDCDGIVGETYTVPMPYAFDVKDGALSHAEILVKNAAGETIVEGTTAETVGFVPNVAGNYTIQYKATDAVGRQTVKTYPLTIYANGFDADVSVSSSTVFSDDTVGVGTKLILPQVFADSALNKTNALLPLNVTVSANGETLDGWNNVSAYNGEEFVFETSGTYVFSFTEALGNLPQEYQVTYNVLADEPTFTLNSRLPSGYKQNDVLPGVEYSFEINGEQLPATATLQYPNGEIQPLAENTLHLAGYYTVSFKTEYAGKTFEHRKTLTVDISEFSVTEDAEAFYGVAEKYDQKRGLVVCLENEEDEFTYNKVVDLNKFDGKTPILSMYALPRTQGTANVKELYVTLTDIYDADNKLVIKYSTRMADIGWYPLYVLGSAQNVEQPFLGVYNNNTTSTTGAMTFVETSKYSGAAILLGFDISTNTAYTNRIGSGSTDMIIADFDNEAHFDNVWGGFTTGEVYVSISAADITERAELLVQKIGEYDLTAENDENTKAPNLLIDYMGYEADSLPKAFVGQKYPLLPYTAKDITGCDSTTRIEVTKGGKNYAVTDGAFTPDSEGEYLVTYISSDGFGSLTEKSYKVNATAKTTSLVLDVVDFNSQAFVGYEYALADYGVYGQTGKANVSVSWKNLGTGESETVSGKTATFDKAGMYAICYQVTDYIGRTAEIVKYLKVETKAELLFTEDVSVPFIMFNGSSYTLPEASAVYKNADGTDSFVKASISVIDAGKTETLQNGVYTPNRSEEGEVTVVYTAEKDGYTTAVLQRSVYIVNNKNAEGALVFESYFLPDPGLSVEKTATGITMTAAEDGKIRFANPVIADGTGINLEAIEEATPAKALNVYFIDSLDKNVVVKLGLTYLNDTQSILSLNNAKRTNIVKGSFTKRDTPLEFSIDNISKSVFNNNGVNLSITKTLNGDTFAGFPSGKVYIEFEFINVVETVSLKLTKINNQFFNVSKDTARAQVVKIGDFGGRTDIDSIASTAIALVGDVLSPNTTVTMTVYDPDLNIVTSVDGVKLENVPCNVSYDILCDKYGDYEILYLGSDGVNKEQATSYVLNVVDATLPTISVTWNLKQTYSVGDTVKLPKMTATDESGIAYSWIMVEDANGRVYIHKEEKFTFTDKGEYVFSYIAYDKQFNMSVVSYKVIVK